MKFIIKAIALWGAGAALAFIACNDKNDTDNAENMLTGTSCWAQVKSEFYNDSTNSWVIFFLPDCSKDDCIQFNSDNTLVMDRGTVKCDTSETQIITGTWSLGADGNTITFVRDDLGGALEYITTELTDSKMVVETDFLGYKHRNTYEAK